MFKTRFCHVNFVWSFLQYCLSMSALSPIRRADERLQGTLSAEKNEMLFSEFNTNYNNEPAQFKKGTSLVRKVVKENGKSVLVAVPLYCDIISDQFWKDNPEILECKPAGQFSNENNSPMIQIKPAKHKK